MDHPVLAEHQGTEQGQLAHSLAEHRLEGLDRPRVDDGRPCEAGIIRPDLAIAAAIEEALSGLGIGEITRTPITAPYVLGMIPASDGKAGV